MYTLWRLGRGPKSPRSALRGVQSLSSPTHSTLAYVEQLVRNRCLHTNSRRKLQRDPRTALLRHRPVEPQPTPETRNDACWILRALRNSTSMGCAKNIVRCIPEVAICAGLNGVL